MPAGTLCGTRGQRPHSLIFCLIVAGRRDPLSDGGGIRAGHRLFDVSRDLVSPVLVGRRHELGRLRSLLTRAMSGEPVVALVAGEAGVGKTRLAQEVARVADDLGVLVLSGGCVELGGEGIPLAPLVDVLRALARAT